MSCANVHCPEIPPWFTGLEKSKETKPLDLNSAHLQAASSIQGPWQFVERNVAGVALLIL